MTEEVEVKQTEQKESIAAPEVVQNSVSLDNNETPQQIDWRKFKEARKVERQQKEAAEKKAQEESEKAAAFKAALEAITNKPAPHYQTENEEDEDTRIQKKIEEALKKDRIRLQEEQKLKEQQEVPQKLVMVYNDFNKVCNEENLDYLEYHYPEIAAGFKSQPDSFDKWSNIYKTLKRFIPSTDTKKDLAKAEKNLSKPQSMSIPGKADTGDNAPVIMTDQRRKDNWARMQKVIKGIN